MVKNLIPCIFLFLTLNATNGICQKEGKDFHASLLSPNAGAFITLKGDVDFFNSFVYLPWWENYKVYQNLVKISLTNSDTIIIKNPFVSLNGSRLWTRSSDIDRDYIGNTDFTQSALLIWRTFMEQAIHRYYPVRGYRAGTPIDLLTIFGYGLCYNKSAALGRLPSNESKYFYDLWANKHTVPEFSRGGESTIIDSDLNSFYLDHSNNRLASKDALSRDRYLVKRTHHYGRQYEYDENVNEYIAKFYSPDPNYNFRRPLVSADSSLEYDLVPGEKLTVEYSEGKYAYHEHGFNTHSEEIANGRFSYDWNIASNNHYLNKENLQNVTVSRHKIYKTNRDREGSISLQLNHGFQIVFLEFNVDLGEKKYALTPAVVIEVSRDSLNWKIPINMTQNGHVINYQFDLSRNSVRGKIFVRIRLGGAEVEIRNFGYTSYFQINRLALPQLKLGSNSVHVFHDNERESFLTLDIKYKEIKLPVPKAIRGPEFPWDGDVVYGPLKRLSWIYPGKGEDIVNYEFILTKDTLTHLPLSPNFQVYTNAINYWDNERKNVEERKEVGVGKVNRHMHERVQVKADMFSNAAKSKNINEFIVHEEGFLNAGESYYWRVRPLNAQGVWGAWSRYFAFHMKKVMPPVKLVATAGELTWDPNPSGARTKSFEVYGSNEYLGFEPKPTDLIGVTSEKKIGIKDIPLTFFRVVAVDSLGNKSEISEYTARPYPYLNDEPPLVHPDSLFQYKLSFTPAFFSMVAGSDEYEYEKRVDTVMYNIVKMPPWLKFNSEKSTIEGKANEKVLRSELNAGSNVIELEFLSEIFPPRKYSLELKYEF